MLSTLVFEHTRKQCDNRNIFYFRDMGLQLFCIHIVDNRIVEERTIEGLLSLIERERFVVDCHLLAIEFFNNSDAILNFE